MRNFCYFFVVVLSLLILSEAGSSKYITQTRILMGTYVTIICDGSREDINGAFSVIKKVENLMSDQLPGSEIYLLNQKGEGEVSNWTAEVIKKAVEFSQITGGAFDISVGPLVDLWRNAELRGRVPFSKELERARSLVGYRNIAVENGRVKLKNEGMRLDLGGIAKGYAVDKAIGVLKRRGVKNALVNAGGDLFCLGEGPHGKWRVGIQHPREEGKIVGIIKISNKAVATSGDYRRYYVIEGRRYGHIINPFTGWTIQGNPMSVTIIAPDTTTADALATGIFVLGPDKGMKIINELPDVEAMIIGEGMSIFTSPGWRNYY